MERIIARPKIGRSIMKRAAFGLLCLLVLIPAAAFADSLDSAAPACGRTCPAAFIQYDFEQFLALKGTGNLLGNVDTQIDISGPAGSFTQSISSASAVDGANGQLLVTLLFSVPDDVLIFTGHYSVILHAIDDTGVRTFGPVYFDVVPQPVVPQPPLISVPENVIAEATSPTGADVFFNVSSFSFVDPAPPAVICNHASGSHFPMGPTSVTCTTTDSFGSASGQFEVEVTDTLGPVLHLPATIVSTSPVVTYTVTATDNVDSSPTVVCSPPSGSTFAIGSTIVSCTAKDSHANFATGTFRVTVTGGATAPTLVVPDDVTAEATGPNGAAVNFTATSSSDATVVCSPASGSTFFVGDTTVGCTATSIGGTSSDSFVITVVDTQPPVLTLPNTINAGATSPSGASINFVVSANDLVDGPTNVNCDYPSGVTLPAGTTIVQCSSSDSHFNVAVGSFTVIVSADVTPPVLNLPANITAEAAGPNGAIVNYAATAIDDQDGAVPVICDHASGSVFPLAVTTVQCTAADSHGNVAHGSFTVTVRDTTPPLLSLPANITAEATSPAGAPASYSATANDLVDGSRPVTCDHASGSTFPIAVTTVQCTASDSHGNNAQGSFTVTVRDTTPPVLSLPASLSAEATGPGGAAVSYSATANDLVDGSRPVTCDHASGSTFPVTVTTVQCTATDSRGNVAQGSFTVTVRDTTPPVLSLPANITAEATSPGGAAVSYSATATDLVDGSRPVTCAPASGSTFALGTTTVQCTATDTHNNTARGSFTVTVRDTTPPVIASVTASPNNLWPPNHQMVNVTVSVIASDAVDPAPTSVIYSVSSNQPINGTGDGDTAPDWQITGPLTLQLRSERASGIARIYTITIATTDASGNTSYGTVTVTVGDGRGRAVH
jgi:hypothetical protein